MKKKVLLLFLCTLLYTVQSNAQEQKIFSSKKIPAKDTVWIFKPSNYDSLQQYATVFLLHGWSSNYKQWSEISNLQYYADLYNFILVCPDGFYDSWYLNSPKQKNWQYESFFFDELLPQLEKAYPIDKQNIFITGLSMGGHGAMLYFIRHNDIFKAAASTSGAINIFDGKLNLGLSRLLGKKNEEADNWRENSVAQNIGKLKGNTKAFLLDCGLSDGLYPYNVALFKKSHDLGLNVIFMSQEGIHNQLYWHKTLPMHLAFFKEQQNSYK